MLVFGRVGRNDPLIQWVSHRSREQTPVYQGVGLPPGLKLTGN